MQILGKNPLSTENMSQSRANLAHFPAGRCDGVDRKKYEVLIKINKKVIL